MPAAADELCPVISRASDGITFLVDDVEEVTTRLPAGPVMEVFKQRLKRPVWASSEDTKVIVTGEDDVFSGCHPFVHAVHQAFNEHRPLELSIDDFAMIIAQGLARHIDANAESLRTRLVRHKRKATIQIETEPPWAWDWIVAHFSEVLRQEVNPQIADAFRFDYTTTTPAIQAAGDIAMMEAFRQYFEYVVVGICGIPRVTLRGTPEDWGKLLHRAEKIAALDLDWWTARLLPILHELLATSAGHPRQAFWRAICKPREAYGGDVISGWMTDLFPYLRSGSSGRNRALEWPRTRWAIVPEKNESKFNPRGLRTAEFPNGLSEASLLLASPDNVRNHTALIGGFLGVCQTPRGSLRPHIGWVVAAADEIVRVLDGIQQQGQVTPAPADFRRAASRRSLSGPAFMAAFGSRFDSAVLFPGQSNEWQLGFHGSCLAERGRVLEVFAVRADGVVLACAREEDDGDGVWVVYAGRIEDPDSLEYRCPKGRDSGLSGVRPLLMAPVRLGDDLTSVVSALLESGGMLPGEGAAIQ